MGSLNQTLKDIARSAPNDWAAFKSGERTDRGTDYSFDYEVYDQGDEIVLYPVSNPAKEWFAAKLPADCPRWGAAGYKIETPYVAGIMLACKRDGILSEDEYVTNMLLNRELEYEAGAAADWAEYQEGDR